MTMRRKTTMKWKSKPCKHNMTLVKALRAVERWQPVSEVRLSGIA